MAIELITSHFMERNSQRREEYLTCLDRNLRNDYLQRVHLFIEHSTDNDLNELLKHPLLDHEKCIAVPFRTEESRSISFNDCVRYANRACGNETAVVLANADIFFDESIRHATRLANRNLVFALTRWNCGDYIKRDGSQWQRSAYSQDAWVFSPQMQELTHDVKLGWFGADNRIAWELAALNYCVANPSNDIKPWHLHASNDRPSPYCKHSYRFNGNSRYVEMVGLEDIPKSDPTTGNLSCFSVEVGTDVVFSSNSVTPFIVLTKGRTGSNFLGSMFRSTGVVEFHGEIFNPVKRSAALEDLLEGKISSLEEFVAMHLRSSNSENLAVGFKMKYDHAFELLDKKHDVSATWQILKREKHLHVIHLKRRNHLRVVVSRALARQTGTWMKTRESFQPGNESVSIDPHVCLREMQMLEKQESAYDTMFQDHPRLSLEFESITKDVEGCKRSVETFLGVSASRFVPSTLRQNDRPLQELVANYDEIFNHLKGTPWEEFCVGNN